MFAKIKHALRIVQHQVRAATKGRSPHWSTCRKDFLKKYPTCAACGSKLRLDVHHVEPFHLDPAKELDTTNLITLCMSSLECHFRLGHGGDYKAFNPLIRADATSSLNATANRAVIEKKAHDLRLYKVQGEGV